MTRKECVDYIMNNPELKTTIKNCEGKSFTNCSTVVLSYYIAEYDNMIKIHTSFNRIYQSVQRLKQLVKELFNDTKQ